MIRILIVLATCIAVGAITHPLIGVALFPLGLYRINR